MLPDRQIAAICSDFIEWTIQGAGADVRHKLSRAEYQKAHGDWDQLLKVSTAADIIRQAGYPLEEHEVISQDGYIMRMERMPNKGRFFVQCCIGFLSTRQA